MAEAIRPMTELMGKSPSNILGLIIMLQLQVEDSAEAITVPYEITSWNSYTCKYMAKPTNEQYYRMFGEVFFDDILLNAFNTEQLDGIFIDEDKWDEKEVEYAAPGNFEGEVFDENGDRIEVNVPKLVSEVHVVPETREEEAEVAAEVDTSREDCAEVLDALVQHVQDMMELEAAKKRESERLESAAASIMRRLSQEVVSSVVDEVIDMAAASEAVAEAARLAAEEAAVEEEAARLAEVAVAAVLEEEMAALAEQTATVELEASHRAAAEEASLLAARAVCASALDQMVGIVDARHQIYLEEFAAAATEHKVTEVHAKEEAEGEETSSGPMADTATVEAEHTSELGDEQDETKASSAEALTGPLVEPAVEAEHKYESITKEESKAEVSEAVVGPVAERVVEEYKLEREAKAVESKADFTEKVVSDDVGKAEHECEREMMEEFDVLMGRVAETKEMDVVESKAAVSVDYKAGAKFSEDEFAAPDDEKLVVKYQFKGDGKAVEREVDEYDEDFLDEAESKDTAEGRDALGDAEAFHELGYVKPVPVKMDSEQAKDVIVKSMTQSNDGVEEAAQAQDLDHTSRRSSVVGVAEHPVNRQGSLRKSVEADEESFLMEMSSSGAVFLPMDDDQSTSYVLGVHQDDEGLDTIELDEGGVSARRQSIESKKLSGFFPFPHEEALYDGGKTQEEEPVHVPAAAEEKRSPPVEEHKASPREEVHTPTFQHNYESSDFYMDDASVIEEGSYRGSVDGTTSYDEFVAQFAEVSPRANGAHAHAVAIERPTEHYQKIYGELHLRDSAEVKGVNKSEMLNRSRDDREDEELEEVRHIVDAKIAQREGHIMKHVSILNRNRSIDEDEELEEIKSLIRAATPETAVGLGTAKNANLGEVKDGHHHRRPSINRVMDEKNQILKVQKELSSIGQIGLKEKAPLAPIAVHHAKKGRRDSTILLLESFMDMEQTLPVSWNMFATMVNKDAPTEVKGGNLSAAMEENKHLKQLMKTAVTIQNMPGDGGDVDEEDYALDDDTLLRLHKRLLSSKHESKRPAPAEYGQRTMPTSLKKQNSYINSGTPLKREESKKAISSDVKIKRNPSKDGGATATPLKRAESRAKMASNSEVKIKRNISKDVAAEFSLTAPKTAKEGVTRGLVSRRDSSKNLQDKVFAQIGGSSASKPMTAAAGNPYLADNPFAQQKKPANLGGVVGPDSKKLSRRPSGKGATMLDGTEAKRPRTSITAISAVAIGEAANLAAEKEILKKGAASLNKYMSPSTSKTTKKSAW